MLEGEPWQGFATWFRRKYCSVVKVVFKPITGAIYCNEIRRSWDGLARAK